MAAPAAQLESRAAKVTCNPSARPLRCAPVSQPPQPADQRPNPVCPRPVCPLSQVRAGTSVRIKQLLAAPELCQRLRELGICEEQQMKLVLQSHSVVCQVCNVRLGLSGRLADSIWVEPIPAPECVA